MGRLDGKVAIITGTGGGQGRAAAIRFASEGAKIVGCDLKESENAETAKLVQESGGEMVSIEPLDLGDETEVQRLFSVAVDAFGGFDIVYNNAAFAEFGPIGDFAATSWHNTIRNELDLIYYACHHAWPHLVKRGGGSIINTSSTAGLVGFETQPSFAHCAAKGAVIALTRQLAAEGASQGIRANAICPGMIETPATAPFLRDPVFRDSMLKGNMLKRYGQPDDVVYCALYLASDEASWTTGAVFVVDGGYTAW